MFEKGPAVVTSAGVTRSSRASYFGERRAYTSVGIASSLHYIVVLQVMSLCHTHGMLFGFVLQAELYSWSIAHVGRHG